MEFPLNTEHPDQSDRSYGFGAFASIQLSLAATGKTYFLAPAKCTLKVVNVSSTVTTDGTKSLAYTAKNLSNSDKALIGTATYNTDPVLTANIVDQIPLSDDVYVEKGDLIEVGVTAGAGAGISAIEFVFETA